MLTSIEREAVNDPRYEKYAQEAIKIWKHLSEAEKRRYESPAKMAIRAVMDQWGQEEQARYEKERFGKPNHNPHLDKDMIQLLKRDMLEPMETAKEALDSAKICSAESMLFAARRLGARLAKRSAALDDLRSSGKISEAEFKELKGLLDDIRITFSEAQSIFLDKCSCKKVK